MDNGTDIWMKFTGTQSQAKDAMIALGLEDFMSRDDDGDLQVTDVFTHEAYPELNRKIRKGMEADRLATISDDAKLVKLADMIDNTSSITEHDPGFAKLYLAEKAHLYDVMGLDAIEDSA